MPRNRITPLTRPIGRNLPIAGVVEVARSDDAAGLAVETDLWSSALEIQNHPAYRQFLPESYRLTNPNAAGPPLDAVTTLPLRRDLPFGVQEPFAMLRTLDGRADGQPGRHLWIEFEIHLSEKNPEDRDAMIGGVCFAGYPYLPYHVTPAGQNSANFGLPHEIRLSWKEQERTGFIDDEDAVTLQLPAAHAGFHVIRTRPLRTRVLRLRLGDFPRLLIKNRSREPEDLLREFWGFLITQLYVFEHDENMQYAPEVEGALVGAYQTPPSFARSYLPELGESQNAPLAARLSGLAPDYVHLVVADGLWYAPLSAASLFAGPRPYRVQTGGSRDGQEIFLSNAAGEGDEIRIVFAQTDPNERCLAGIRVTGPGPKLPFGLELPLAPFRYAVYELDTLEGASPLRFDAPDADKYALRLASGVVEDPANFRSRTIRFERPSLARYFLLVLTVQAENAHVGLARIELIQSASVVLAARPARAIRVERMHFRLRGAELASDFARLGEKGMGLRLDFLQGDQRRQTLLEAHSLLDLLDLGARLHRNSRHLEVRRELSESRNRTHGWSRSETGDGVAWESAGASEPVDDRPSLPDHGGAGFDSFGTQETRTHTEHVGFEGELARDLRDQVVRINRVLRRIPNVGDNEFVTIPPIGVHRLTDGFGTFWRGIPEEDVQTIRGLYNLNVPPHSAAAQLGEAALDLFTGGPTNPALPTDLTDFVTDLFPTLLLGGLTASIGGSFYGSVSISSGQMIPSASRVTTTGETGVVVRSATTTPYHYNQTLNDRFDGSRTERTVLERDKERTTGGDVAWRGQIVDLISGSVPVGITLPALASSGAFQTSDQSVRLQFLNGIDPGLDVEIWFEVTEEYLRDDY